MKLPSQCGQQLIKKADERYAEWHATAIVMDHFLLPESNFLLELSQFFVYSSLQGGNDAHQLLELQVDIED